VEIQELDGIERDVGRVGCNAFDVAQVEEILAEFILSEEVGGAVKVGRQLSHRSKVRLLRPRGQPAQLHVLKLLAFWDRRMLYVLDRTERDGKLFIPEIAIVVNDLSLPLWAAIPPREAARIAIETAEELGRRLEGFPAALLDEIHGYNERWVVRALHRGEHLDEVDRALNG